MLQFAPIMTLSTLSVTKCLNKLWEFCHNLPPEVLYKYI